MKNKVTRSQSVTTYYYNSNLTTGNYFYIKNVRNLVLYYIIFSIVLNTTYEITYGAVFTTC